jgi:hypothetical protein
MTQVNVFLDSKQLTETTTHVHLSAKTIATNADDTHALNKIVGFILIY